MKFTKIPVDTFNELVLNAGILTSAFTPSTGSVELENILGATDGGVTCTATPEYADFGEGIDNASKNIRELKRITSWECKIAGTFKTVTPSLAKQLLGGADIDADDSTKITLRNELKDSDFADIWFVADYSSKNGETNGGFIAIHLLNALSTSGFSLQSANKDKGSFSAEFTGHSTMADPDVVPFEVYIKEGLE